MEVCVERVSVTTTGSDAAATGSGSTGAMNGLLMDIYLNYHADAPSTTDVTVSFADTPPSGNVLVVTDSKTDALYHPRAKPVDNANAAITNAHDRFALCGALTFSVAGADALTGCLVATVRYLRG